MHHPSGISVSSLPPFLAFSRRRHPLRDHLLCITSSLFLLIPPFDSSDPSLIPFSHTSSQTCYPIPSVMVCQSDRQFFPFPFFLIACGGEVKRKKVLCDLFPNTFSCWRPSVRPHLTLVSFLSITIVIRRTSDGNFSCPFLVLLIDWTISFAAIIIILVPESG